jgi:anti-anti-sigma factor
MSDPSRSPEAMPSYCPGCGSQVSIALSGPAADHCCPHCGRSLWFLRRSQGEVVVLTFLPRSVGDKDTVEQVDEVVSAVGGVRRVVLDLSRLRLISAFFLGMLVRLHLKMEAAHATLKVCGLRRESQEVFRVTKLDSLFPIYGDEEAAIDSF